MNIDIFERFKVGIGRISTGEFEVRARRSKDKASRRVKQILGRHSIEGRDESARNPLNPFFAARQRGALAGETLCVRVAPKMALLSPEKAISEARAPREKHASWL